MSDLLKLAERCEAATGPDRELDLRIEAEINPDYAGMDEDHSRWLAKYGGHPRYTASIDAAMTLRPEGHTMASMGEEDTHDPLRKCAAEYRRGFKTSYDKAFPARAATLPLALCAAALRARSEAAAVGGR